MHWLTVQQSQSEPQKGRGYGKSMWKIKQQRGCFLDFDGAQLPGKTFFSIMLYTQLLAIPLYLACAYTVYIAVRIAVQFSISVDLWAGWFII